MASNDGKFIIRNKKILVCGLIGCLGVLCIVVLLVALVFSRDLRTPQMAWNSLGAAIANGRISGDIKNVATDRAIQKLEMEVKNDPEAIQEMAQFINSTSPQWRHLGWFHATATFPVGLTEYTFDFVWTFDGWRFDGHQLE